MYAPQGEGSQCKRNLTLIPLKRKTHYVGLDISASTVKLVELSHSGKRFQVESVGAEPIPEGMMEDHNPSDPEGVGAAVKRLLRTSGTGLKNAAVAVPTSSVITRVIPMPVAFSESEIEANIQLEASQYIPFPLEEIYLDFQVQGVSKSDSSTQDVMIVASRREHVDLREETLQEAGLNARIVDVEAYALENTFHLMSDTPKEDTLSAAPRQPSTAESKCTAFIDIGAAVTTLYIFDGDRIIFTREQAFGGDQLTLGIAETYGLPKDRAELAKRSGELSEDYTHTVLAHFRQALAEQVSQALQYFFASSHFNSVDRIILTGGGSLTPGIDETIADLSGTTTVVGNPFRQMENSKRVNRRSLMRDGPLFAVACGLALRSFD
jgi:type IV pilus assembly protein PilM